MFSKANIQDLPVEATLHSSGTRKVIVNKNETTSNYFEAYTYGYMPAGAKYEMHEHDNIVEICVVTKGEGIIRDDKGNEESFSAGDRFIFPANTKHEIENTSNEEAEFYFFRVRNQ